MMSKIKKKNQQDPLKKYQKEKPKNFKLMSVRNKIEEDVKNIKVKINKLSDKYGNDFLPLLFVCSETNSDIMQVKYIPEDLEEKNELAFKIGEAVSINDKNNDLYGLVLVSIDDENIIVEAKSINGEVKCSSSNESKKYWSFDDKNVHTFINSIWSSYRFNSIIKSLK